MNIVEEYKQIVTQLKDYYLIKQELTENITKLEEKIKKLGESLQTADKLEKDLASFSFVKEI